MIRWIYRNSQFKAHLFVRRDFFAKLEFIFVAFVSVFFTVIFSTLISPFNCKYQSDSSYILWYAPSINCYEGEWLGSHLTMMVLFIFIYIVLYIAIIAKAFIKIYKSNMTYSSATVEFLTRTYNDRTYWWEAVHILKRVSIIACGVMLPRSKGSEVYVIMFFVLLGFLLLDILAFPYQRKSMMRLSLMWNSIMLLLLMTDGFVFKSSYVSEEVKRMVGILNIVLILLAFILSIRQAYLSRIMKVRKRFFEGSLVGLDEARNLMNVEFVPDTDIIEEYKAQNLVKTKIKIGFEWKSDISNISAAASSPVNALRLETFETEYIDSGVTRKTATSRIQM
jgi:hypothetical protein